MTGPLTISETVEFRVVLVEPESRAVLVIDAVDGYCLPRIRISQGTRSTKQICKAIKDMWGLHALIVEFVTMESGSTSCVVAELLNTTTAGFSLNAVELSDISDLELSEIERLAILQLLHGPMQKFPLRIGWIDEAIIWMERSTGRKLSSKWDIEQWNAGGGFALVKFQMDDGHVYWLKATGAPNSHELALMVHLSELCPDVVPPLVAVRNEWNAWLTENVGGALQNQPAADVLVSAANGFALLQFRTADCLDMFLSEGAFDQRLPVLRSHIDPIMAYLIDAMERQESTKVARLSCERLRELADILREVCVRIEGLGIPDALIHNDISASNILYDEGRCVFIDWSEASVGNPFLSCERLCELNPNHREKVQSAYRRSWSQRLSATAIDEAFALMPLLAIYAYLYGRGDWLTKQDIRPPFESYRRSLARHMDRAAKNTALLGVLCH